MMDDVSDEVSVQSNSWDEEAGDWRQIGLSRLIVTETSRFPLVIDG